MTVAEAVIMWPIKTCSLMIVRKLRSWSVEYFLIITHLWLTTITFWSNQVTNYRQKNKCSTQHLAITPSAGNLLNQTVVLLKDWLGGGLSVEDHVAGQLPRPWQFWRKAVHHGNARFLTLTTRQPTPPPLPCSTIWLDAQLKCHASATQAPRPANQPKAFPLTPGPTEW